MLALQLPIPSKMLEMYRLLYECFEYVAVLAVQLPIPSQMIEMHRFFNMF